MLSNAYFLAKFRFDTAENEPAKNLQKFKILQNLPILPGRRGRPGLRAPRAHVRGAGAAPERDRQPRPRGRGLLRGRGADRAADLPQVRKKHQNCNLVNFLF